MLVRSAGQPLGCCCPKPLRRPRGARPDVRRPWNHASQMGEALDLTARRKNGGTFVKCPSPDSDTVIDAAHGGRPRRHDTAANGAVLQSAVDATSASVGTEFFRHLVRSLAELNGVSSAYLSLADTAGDDAMRTVAFWHDGRFLDDLEYRLEGTPSAQVVSRGLVFYSRGARAEFSGDRWLQEERIEGYLGLPLRHTDGSLLGVMAVMSRQAIELTGTSAALRSSSRAAVGSSASETRPSGKASGSAPSTGATRFRPTPTSGPATFPDGGLQHAAHRRQQPNRSADWKCVRRSTPTSPPSLT